MESTVQNVHFFLDLRGYYSCQREPVAVLILIIQACTCPAQDGSPPLDAGARLISSLFITILCGGEEGCRRAATSVTPSVSPPLPDFWQLVGKSGKGPE